MAASMGLNIGLGGGAGVATVLGDGGKGAQQKQRLSVLNANPGAVLGCGITPTSAYAPAVAPPMPSSAPPGQPPPQSAPLSHGFACEQNARWRKYMEDSHTAVHDFAGRAGSLYAGVYDGHGGRAAVDFVTQHLHAQLKRELDAAGANANIHECLRGAFLKVDRMLMQVGAVHCGTTVAVALCLRASGPSSPLTIHVANAGDTRVLLVAEGGLPVRRLSVDHVATDPAEVKRVQSVGGTVVNNRVGGSLAVTRALGDHCLKDGGVSADPHYMAHEVGACDKFVVMASDGVWDVMTDLDAQELLLAHAHESCDELAERVVKQALNKGTRDNLSCLVIKLK